jgi:hypothetical protein
MSCRAYVGLAILLGLASIAEGDVLICHDGRTFEGEIFAETPEVVAIDTVVATIRTTLKIPRDQVKAFEKKPVPDGFFDPPPRPSERGAVPTEGLYLEVPIVGRFGTDVYAEALREILLHAHRQRIGHLVFVIDSRGHHDVDEAREVARTLHDCRGGVTYHALVRTCVGDALAVGLLADTIHVAPGGTIGGSPDRVTGEGQSHDADEEAIVRRQMAHEAARVMQERGKPGVVIRKMIDPAEPLAVWMDEDGSAAAGEEPPQGLPKDRLIFQSGADETLVLGAEQLGKLGLPTFEGGAAGLGKALGMEGWRLQSEYGSKRMAYVAARRKRFADVKAARFEATVKRNLTRREAADLVLQRSVEGAAKWDPTKASYETYGHRWRWGWGGRRYYDGRTEGTRLTQESRKKWQTRTDMSLAYLRRAIGAAVALERLDAEAVELGLEPTYNPGELNQIKADLAVKFAALQRRRDARSL